MIILKVISILRKLDEYMYYILYSINYSCWSIATTYDCSNLGKRRPKNSVSQIIPSCNSVGPILRGEFNCKFVKNTNNSLPKSYFISYMYGKFLKNLLNKFFLLFTKLKKYQVN
jgi:hypothetical protein